MKRRCGLMVCALLLGLSASCSKSDQEKAHERAEEARAKARRDAERARQEARKLGHEMKDEANSLSRKVDRAVQKGESSGSTETAGQKIDQAQEQLRNAGKEAAVKLDRAGMIAKVKARLAADVGVSTAARVDVDAAGQTITLRGTVASEDDKEKAESAARQVDGVSKVVNLIEVQP